MNPVKFTKPFFARLIPLAASLLLVACTKPAPVAEPVRAVKVVTVGVQSMQSGLELAGEVRARVESQLGFRVGGKLLERQAEVGQRVKAGQVLARLDPQDYKLAAEAAKAQLAAAATNRDLAGADFKRYKELKDQNFISSAELERRDTTLKAAQAQFEQAQAQLSGQANQVGYATLMADVAGVITAVQAEPGQVVAAGTPVVRIAQDGARDVVFSVPEDKVAAIKMGAGMTVQLWPASTMLKGVVREVAASADPVTRTFLVKLALDAKEAPVLGTTVSVLPQGLVHAGVPVIKLPTSALRQDGQSTAVWLLDGASMTVKLQPVTLAGADGNDAVITSGLAAGQVVVTAGVHVLNPGQKVKFYVDPTVPSASAASGTGGVPVGVK